MRGLVIESSSSHYKVQVVETIYTCTARGKLKDEDMAPVVGDFVELDVMDKENKEGVIGNVIHRKTFIKRPKLANVTQLALVMSLKNPEPDLLLLDKELAFAEFSGMHSIIVLNKIDLDTRDSCKKIEDIYGKAGYKVYAVDALTGIGIDNLKYALRNNKNAFSGVSGVGKSSIVNRIVGKEVAIPGAISEKLLRGKNTTTTTTLHQIGTATYIADTPGFASFDVSEIPAEDLDKNFKDIKAWSMNCKYDDCTHIKELDCGVKKAVEKGAISKSRYNNYVKIFTELKDKETHKW
jgi:ribosome biogenesis GTPase